MSNEFFVNHKNGMKQKGLYWPCEEAKKNVIIATGMQEMSSRYSDFAKFLNSKGFNVWCLDAFGQGLNVSNLEDLQKWPKNGFSLCVDGLALTLELAKKNNLPTYLFGHSMGSFMVQSVLERYPGIAEKYVICGSDGPNALLYSVATFLTKVVVNKRNWDKPSSFLTNLAMGAYPKPFKDRKTDLDWLSVNEANVEAYIKDPYCGCTNTNGFWHEFLGGLNTLYKKKNLSKISKESSILIVSGSDDPVGKMSKGPLSLEKMYHKLGLADVTCIIYDGMRHEILNEKTNNKVYADILGFLLR